MIFVEKILFVVAANYGYLDVIEEISIAIQIFIMVKTSRKQTRFAQLQE